MSGNDEKDAGVPNQRMPVDGDDAAMDCAAIEDEMVDDYIASVVTEAVHVLIPDEDLEALLLEAKSKAVSDTLADAKDSPCGNLASAALGIAWAGDSGRPMETVSLSSSSHPNSPCKESLYLTVGIPSTPHGSDDAKQKSPPTRPRRLKRLIFLGASTGASAGTLVSTAALLPRAQEALRGPTSVVLLTISALLLALGISTALVYHRAVQATSSAYQQGRTTADGNSESNKRSRIGVAGRMRKNERAAASA